MEKHIQTIQTLFQNKLFECVWLFCEGLKGYKNSKELPKMIL